MWIPISLVHPLFDGFDKLLVTHYINILEPAYAEHA